MGYFVIMVVVDVVRMCAVLRLRSIVQHYSRQFLRDIPRAHPCALSIYPVSHRYVACSIAVEPLYPPICSKHPVLLKARDATSLSPMQLSARLNSIPSSLSYERDYPLNIVHLIVVVSDATNRLSTCI